MQKKLPFIFALLVSLSARSQTPALTINNTTGSNSITCAVQAINLVAGVSNYTSALTYLWQGPGPGSNNAGITVNTAGQYTVVAYNTANSFSLTQTITIGLDVTAPTSTITPTLQNMTCLSAAQNVTATVNPTTNITQRWYSDYAGAPAVANSYIAIYTPGAPGTYTHCVTSNVNGCSTCKTFTVTSSDNFPILSATCQQNFMLGCGTNTSNIISLSGSTAPNPSGAINFTLLPPGFSGPYNTGTILNYIASVPGTYTAVIRDLANQCETKAAFTVLAPVFPDISVTIATQTLSCYVPSSLLQAGSQVSTTTFKWLYTGGSVNTSSFTANINASATSSVSGNYTVTVTNTVNICRTSSVIPIFQNVYPPNVSISGNTGITCTTETISLLNSSSTGIPAGSAFSNSLSINAFLWQGPVPQTTLSNSNVYMAATPGVYMLIVQDPNNGCTSQTTTTVSDLRTYPVITSTNVFAVPGTAPIDVYPTVTGSTANLTYLWSGPAGSGVSGATTATVSTHTGGQYTVIVTNTANGCSSSLVLQVYVLPEGINSLSSVITSVNIFPNPGNGVFTVVTSNTPQNATLELVNILGAIIRTQTLTANETSIDLKNEPNGIYSMRILQNSKTLYSAKLVKN